MKCSKAAGPSGILPEMLKAAGEEGVELVRQLTEAVFSCGVIPSDWEESFILNLYKGKGEVLDHGNYHGLKLTDQVMKLLERVLDIFIHEMVNIDEMQFGFVPGRGTTDAIFIVRQQEKYIAAKKLLYCAFIDLEKAFDHVPRKGLWRALRSLGVEEWTVCVIEGMYSNACSRVRVNGQYSEEFGVGVGVRQPTALNSGTGGVLAWVLYWCTMGASLHWWHGAESPSSRHGRLAWKVKGSMSTWRRPSSWGAFQKHLWALKSKSS